MAKTRCCPVSDERLERHNDYMYWQNLARKKRKLLLQYFEAKLPPIKGAYNLNNSYSQDCFIYDRVFTLIKLVCDDIVGGGL